jgi:phosphohistidine phosphatase
VRVLLVRHAAAVDRLAFEGSDADRPLTPEGARRFRRAARALAAGLPELEMIASSPLARAKETADLLAAALAGKPERIDLGALEPDARPAAALAWLRSLRSQRELETVALVGHEPHLSRLEAWLLAAREQPFAVFRKGGAALIELSGRIAAGRGELRWHLTASQLRELDR